MAVGCLTETYSKGVGMAALPTGTVTFLFTDLEGSTRLWEEHSEAMRDALARHDEILRTAVEKRDGVVVKTAGDGLPVMGDRSCRSRPPRGGLGAFNLRL